MGKFPDSCMEIYRFKMLYYLPTDTKIFVIGNSNWRSIDKEYVIQTYILLMYITKLVFMTS